MKKILLLLVVMTSVFYSFGQIVDPFSIRHQTNQKGGIVMLANVSVGCSCTANNQTPPGGNGDNNNFSMGFVDIDSDGSTFMSSSDQLGLANCSEITWAGLYWTGKLDNQPSTTPNWNIRNQVKLSIDGGGYMNLTADELTDNTTGKINYFCFKDITSIMQANPIDATYRVANIVTETGSNTFGGWTIVVVYNNIYETMKNLTVFDGIANVSSGSSGTVNIPLSGFLTPPSGAVSFELGVVAHDGDRGQSGDQMEFNGAGTYVNISDAIHDANNLFNSTISNGGVLTPLRNPSYDNNLGHDANIYTPDNTGFNYIGNAATNADIRISTQSETVLTSVITSAIDIYEPDLRASVTYTDLNGGSVEPGDILEYSISAKNIGSDISIGTILTDTLDNRLTYVPGSINITYGPNSGPKTDPIDADQAEFIAADNVIVARIGTGADGTTGGQVVNSPTGADSTVITFQVELTNDCAVWQCGAVLENQAFLFGTGQISGITNGNGGASDLLDQNGCPSLESGIVTVDLSTCADTVITYTDSLCVGEDLILDFPNSGFLTYQWTGPNGFTSTINNPMIPNVQLTDAGDYVLHVFYDGVECITDTTAPVFVSDNPTILLNELRSDSCFNLGDGFIDIAGVGNAPFTFTWSNADTDSLAEGLGAGTYDVLIEDQYGCTAVDTFTITEPTLLEVTMDITSDYNGQDISCFGAMDGSASATGSGGVTPYTYLWTPNSEITPGISSLDIGTYVVTLTDSNGCEVMDSVTLVQPDSISITAALTDVLCFDDTTGTINATISGGTTPYTFGWSNGETTEDITNVGAGIYTDTVTDINGCVNFESFEIFEPVDSMSFSHISTEIFCFGDSTGSIDLSVVGGTTPYTYLWSNTEITEDIFDIPGGVYDVTVTDSNNCTQTTSITVDQPTAVSITETHIDPVCQAGTQGSIDLDASGGTPGYTYYWNNGEITDTITQLNAGTYFCIVTDTNQCTDTISVTIVDPDAVLLAETHTDVPCYGDSTGTIDITPSGGSPGYTFDWSNSETTEDVSNLSAGLYWVDAYDINNCGGFLSIVISEPDTSMYLTSSSHVNVLCFGDSTGSIDVEFAGGVAPYTYLWDNMEVTQDIQDLSSGVYNLVVTDSNGCTLNFADTIAEPTDMILSETHVDVLCFGDSTGSVDLTASGGVTPYIYGWSNAETTEDLTAIPAGSYTVIVADSNGCLDTLTAIVAQPLNPINLQASTTAVLCFGGDDGGIDLSTSGGTAPYNWEWSNAETTEDLTDLEAGLYSVVVTDTNGCIDSLLANVVQPSAPLTLNGSATPVCFGDTTGVATVFPAGGTPGYSYLWDTGNPNDTLSSLGGLGQGTYDVTVTDTNGCENSIYITVEEPVGLDGCVVINIPNVFTPNDDNVNDLFLPTEIRNIQEYNIIIVNRWGSVMFESSEISFGWDGRTKSGSLANEGTYFWIVRYVDNYGDADKKHGNLTLIRE